MTIDELLKQAREIWGDKRMSDQQVLAAMGTVFGDISRFVRDNHEQKDVNKNELKKELGNIIFSTIRWADDLGFNPNECVELAKEAQRKYNAKPTK